MRKNIIQKLTLDLHVRITQRCTVIEDLPPAFSFFVNLEPVTFTISACFNRVIQDDTWRTMLFDIDTNSVVSNEFT